MNVFSKNFKKITAKRNNFIARLVILITLIVSSYAYAPVRTNAAPLTSLKGVFNRIETGIGFGGATFTFATPTGIQTGGGDTITMTWSSDFTLAAENVNNFDIGLGDSGTCSTATYTDETVSLTASATDWGVDVTGQVMTFSPETDDTLSAGFCVRIRMGDNAVTGATGSTTTVTNGNADDDDYIDFAGGIGDTGRIGLDIIADDTVNVTATVNSSITFTISDTTIGFGTLLVSTGRWATSDGSSSGGADASAATPTVAHTMTLATNATDGYTITYKGATLTNASSDTISVATIAADSDGTPGTEQFGFGVSTDGDATIASGYARTANGTSAFKFVADTTTTILSETGPTATETFSLSYLANIAGTTEPGDYSTNITYIATGVF